MARAASTYRLSLRWRISALVIRTIGGMAMTVSATTKLTIPPCRIVTAMPMARINGGNENTTSMARMTSSSTTRPANPARAPSTTLITNATDTTMLATARSTRAPWTTREKMSRPNWSVPMMCCADGGCVVLSRSPLTGFAGAIKGAKMADTTTIAINVRPTTVSVFWLT